MASYSLGKGHAPVHMYIYMHIYLYMNMCVALLHMLAKTNPSFHLNGTTSLARLKAMNNA